MFTKTGVSVLAVGAVLIFGLLAWMPGIALGEETPDETATEREALEVEGDFGEKREDRMERKLERIKALQEEDLLTEEEAASYKEAIEEKVSLERGECPEDGSRNCELKLNLKEHQDERRQEKRDGNGSSQNRHHFKGGW